MQKMFYQYKKLIINAVRVMMGIVLFLSVIDLGWMIFKDIISSPIFLLSVEELLDLFGLFLIVVIGIELLESLSTYFQSEWRFHYEIVLRIALIAIARKVIILNIYETSAFSILAIAAVIVSLVTGLFLVKRT